MFVRVMVLAALAVTYLASHKGRTRLLWLLPLFVVGAVLSGSRGGMVAFAVVVILGGWPMLRRMRRKVAVRLLVLAVVAVAVVPRMLGPETLDSLRTRWVVLTFEGGYSSGRDSIYSQVWELFSASPFFGVGLDGYYGLVGQYSGFEYPHNVLMASVCGGRHHRGGHVPARRPGVLAVDPARPDAALRAIPHSGGRVPARGEHVLRGLLRCPAAVAVPRSGCYPLPARIRWECVRWCRRRRPTGPSQLSPLPIQAGWRRC